jgi:hypothetical protein
VGQIVVVTNEQVCLEGDIELEGPPGGGKDGAQALDGVDELVGVSLGVGGLDPGTHGGKPVADGALTDAELGGDDRRAQTLAVESEGAIAWGWFRVLSRSRSGPRARAAAIA